MVVAVVKVNFMIDSDNARHFIDLFGSTGLTVADILIRDWEIHSFIRSSRVNHDPIAFVVQLRKDITAAHKFQSQVHTILQYEKFSKMWTSGR